MCLILSQRGEIAQGEKCHIDVTYKKNTEMQTTVGIHGLKQVEQRNLWEKSFLPPLFSVILFFHQKT